VRPLCAARSAGTPDCLSVPCSEGGVFNAVMTFPPDYPNSPPALRFTSEMWHPNGAAWRSPFLQLFSCLPSPSCAVYPDGNVCISILHAPGDDPHGYEQASERWSPVQTVSTILLSISACSLPSAFAASDFAA